MNLLGPVRDLRSRVIETVDRVGAMAAVGWSSGLGLAIRPPGARELVRALVTGVKHFSVLYRIHGRNSPDKPAILWRDRTLTFGELDARIDAVAVGLREHGVTRGKAIILMMKNRPEYIELGAGAGRAGAAVVAASWRSVKDELVYLATRSQAVALAFEHDLWPVVEEAMRELPQIPASRLFCVGGEIPGTVPAESLMTTSGAPLDSSASDDATLITFTSGTTGKAKGAVRGFSRATLSPFMRYIALTPIRHDDMHLVTGPLYHSLAYAFLAFTHMVGGTVVLMDGGDPETFLELVQRHRITTASTVPTMLYRVLGLPDATLRRYDTRSLRAIFCGGAPLPGPLAVEFMDKVGDVVFNTYGSTETGLVTLATPRDLREAPGTVGRVTPGNLVRILDDEGREVRPGEVGELYVKNPVLISGYHGDAAATRASMKDGYFSVGDLARVDPEGRYFIEGRKRDMIITGGVNVYPAEVEAVFEGHPEIAEVAVVGVPDPQWGERVRAFVSTKPGSTLDEEALKRWGRDRLSGPKVPRDVVFLPALPRNPTGKVLKRELRAYMGTQGR